MKQSKSYPYLRAFLDGLIEAAPNWAKAPARFAASLSDQLKDKRQEENKQLEKEIRSISEKELRTIIKEAGSEQKADLKFIVENIEPIIAKIKTVPDISKAMDHRFDKVDDKLDEIERLLQRQQPTVKFPLAPGLHNQTPPEVHFVGRKGMLGTICEWYKSPEVRVGALIGWGGVGKSALVRKWYDSLDENEIRPDGIFWWGFYRNAYLEQFLNALLRYVSGGQIEPDNIKGTWEKVEKIKEYIHQGRYLIVLDGLEQMQKGESGGDFGKMLNRELTEMLHYLADGPKTEGLCLITTRYTMKDLEDWQRNGYENLELTKLDEPDAMLMLKKRGIKGSDEKIKAVIKRYKGHALSLTLLAGYLKKYYKGDVEQALDVEFVLSDKERFKDVNKLLRRYAEKMSEAERVFLNIFSLFRQDVTEDDFAGVFRKEIEDAEFSDVLVKMDGLDFRDLVNGLVDWRLISYDEEKEIYSTHPLIKGYFETDFDEEDKKLCHKRIYQYFGEDAPERPETLEEMQPLFEQVYHGCGAGLYDEVIKDIYYDRIRRSYEHFITHKLGAWETDLSLAGNFFPEGDLSQMPLVSNKNRQSWLFGVAGLALLNIGRPKEAEEPTKRHNQIMIEIEDWGNTSTGYLNLADLQFRIGDLESGLESAKKALEFADKAQDESYIWVAKSCIGWILFLLGKSNEAEKTFKEADDLVFKIASRRLRGMSGVWYAQYLLSIKKIDEAFELAERNHEICLRNKWTNDISRCKQILGVIERIKANDEKAKDHLQDALEGARKVGMPELEVEALLELGRLWLDLGKNKNAICNAEEVLKICGRTGFRFYEPGAEIVLGKTYLAEANFKEAEKNAKSAYDKAFGMKYRWAEGDAGHLLGEVYLEKGDKVKAREWLEKAVKCRKEILDPYVEETEKLLNDYC